MENTFARIIETSNHQVLVTKDYDVKEDRLELKVEVQINGDRVTGSVGFSNEGKRDEAFNSYDLNKAEGFVQGMKAIYS